MSYRFADILLPSNVGLLTYAVGELECAIGDAVAVEMGQGAKGLFYTGIIWRLHNEQPNFKRIRTITKRLYDAPLLSSEQRAFWEWIADYYICSLNDIMRGVLPTMIRPKGGDELSFESSEYRPAMESYVELLDGELKIQGAKSQEALAEVVALSHEMEYIPRRLLRGQTAQLRTLERRGAIAIVQRERRVELAAGVRFALPRLTPHQQQALEKIEQGYATKNCALLHGVTGSGKTEIYIHMIAKRLSEGRDVLMLLPEIALTTQLIERMQRIFGSRVTPYHSKIPARRRTELFMELIRSGEGGKGEDNGEEGEGGRFILGARSALFLPLSRLGLVVVDEEHDSSYKQVEPSPRYNARDASHILVQLYGGKLLLGSATPSLESWVNASTGRFTYAKLSERYGDARLPEIVVSDSIRAGKRRERQGHFNKELVDALHLRLDGGEQAMLLQNRRGFAPYVECAECGWVARCPNCNVSLTMHKSGGVLRCHYCDHATTLPSLCPTCHQPSLEPRGFGTEKIEEQLGEILPKARVVRLDRDVVTSMGAVERIVSSFERHESDIMVGTQMIAKGFDFSRVTLVGILNADNLLMNPDFRAEERAFALITQVAGRAGRRDSVNPSQVVVQSSQPDHRVLQYVKEQDYEGFARILLEERESYAYPPYSRIIEVTLRHKDANRLHSAANILAEALRGAFGRRLRGPVAPLVDKVQGEWIVQFLLKIERGASSKLFKERLRQEIEQWRKIKGHDSILLICNVDPQ